MEYHHLNGNNEINNFPFDNISIANRRFNRTGSLGLPNDSLLDAYDKQQEECSSATLLPTTNLNMLRRHSAHCCQSIEKQKHQQQQQQQHQQIFKKFSNPSTSTNYSNNNSTTSSANLYSQANIQMRDKKSNSSGLTGTQSSPPPIPQRTFNKRVSNVIMKEQQNMEENGGHLGRPEKIKKLSTKNHISNDNYLPIFNKGQSFKKSYQNYPRSNFSEQQHSNAILRSNENEQISDDERSLENSVFDEEETSTLNSKSNILNLSSLQNKMLLPNGLKSPNNSSNSKTSQYIHSNRSSSESNKSQATTDTGYRSRFSSVDTQSSLESCLTDKTIDSPLSKDSFRIDFSRGSDQDYGYNTYMQEQLQQKNKTQRNLPAIPNRKSESKKILNNDRHNSEKHRDNAQPPTPPLRSQNSGHLINFDILKNVAGTGRKLPEINSKQTTTQRLREKFSNNCPVPLQFPHKNQQFQDSSDSYSMTSSPGYNTKNSLDTPLIQSQMYRQNNKYTNPRKSNPQKFLKQNQPPPLPNRVNLRQDSTISTDSCMSASSQGYNTETQLLPSMKTIIQDIKRKPPIKNSNDIIQEYQDYQPEPVSPITKSSSIPASLQTVVRFQNGTSNMTLHHRILNKHEPLNGRLKFRILQISINILALIAITGGLFVYFNAYPTIKFINKTIITPIRIEETTELATVAKNPAPGICLPIIVRFCQGSQVPYNYTVFPNYIGHFGQMETQVDLEAYDALVDVRCYELVTLFLCTLFVPKCGPTGTTVPPCKSLCIETMRRCGFFFDVFGLLLPDYLDCNLFEDHKNSDECVGYQQVKAVMRENTNPSCNGFLCDSTRCIPNDWRCDGHVDCYDQTDESNCTPCDKDSIYCGEGKCMNQNQMCDGKTDCPYGQDERSCVRLSQRNGDIGKGVLEIYKSNGNLKDWIPACINNWDNTFSPTSICSMLGYASVNYHQLSTVHANRTILEPTKYISESYHSGKRYVNLMENFLSCSSKKPDYPIIELTCSNFECGKISNKKYKSAKRIVGGSVSKPGDWPFLAAILGGPEEIFYCAGVLISDQWVLTASHCIGNHTLRDINDWTIQLGITRRNSHAYYGQKVKVITVIPHPQYNTEIAHDNDIALFQLSTRVAFHDYLRPVCLPPPNLSEIKAGTQCTVIGWGKREDKNLSRFSSSNSVSYELSVNEVKVPIVKREVCDEWLESLNVTQGMICAGYVDGGKDACQGDSGGPLLCPWPGKRDRWYVGGIVSWGIMCAHPRLPGVYANVIKYVPWIKNEINKYGTKSDNKKI